MKHKATDISKLTCSL